MTGPTISLEDKYTRETGRVYMSGLQALVRLPMTQMRRDRQAGLNTGTFISGYRGSPLGNYDQQLLAANDHLKKYDIEFQPGVNEDLAATAVWGSQQLHLSPGARKDGVLGMWYGKGPGVDRSGDVFKHGNAAGSAPHGGVLCLAGDDHSCKSSTVPHQSDHAFMSAIIPMLYPSSIHEFLEVGLLGVAMSRFSGCWVGMKFISDTVETTAAVDLSGESRVFNEPDDFDMPPGGLNLRWPDPPLEQDERLQEYKAYAAIAFGRANGIDLVTVDNKGARLGIVASGKAYEDVRQALKELQIGDKEAQEIGLRIYKVRMPWPLEPQGIRHFSEGLEEVLVVEERREIIENQIKQQLFNWRADVRPRIIGKFDHEDKPFLPHSAALTVGATARAIADRILRLDVSAGLKEKIAAKLGYLDKRHELTSTHAAPILRTPFYCAGCPHNTSTRVPEGSKAMAGIGCHYMVQWMDRNTETFTQMGGEGVPWTATSRFTDEKHRFVNLGDGTYFHSGLLAIRQSVAANVNLTYKLLYNDAVAMTGGQSVDGNLTPQMVTHQLHHEGVAPIYFLTDRPDIYDVSELAPGTILKHRDYIDQVMLEVREKPGCSAIVYEQTCAAEKRRRRKRGLMEDPDKRIFIHPAVCEGCGDCSEQSNCIAVEPLETEMGRKRKINQSSCNKDYSCVKGFCPSFVTIDGGKPRKNKAVEGATDDQQQDNPVEAVVPALTDRPFNIAITGVGGTGVLTIGAILGMAAHIEGKAAMVLDMAGLAQKGGAVLSHVRIGSELQEVTSPRIVTGGADLLLAADDVVAASSDGATLCDPDRTHAVVNTAVTPVADFVRNRDLDFKSSDVTQTVRMMVTSDENFHDFTQMAVNLAGDAIATNIMMLGYAWQKGLVPLERASLEGAIALNGVAVNANLAAFRWGRLMADDFAKVAALCKPGSEKPALADMSLDELIAHRSAHLASYQNKSLANRYRDRVAQARDRAGSLLDSKDADRVTRAIAQNYAKVLAYKDEYEVARLFTDASFKEQLSDTFDGDYRLTLNLAPPFLSGKAPNGRPKKRQFGPWVLKLFAVMKRFRGLRGTAFDPFGYSQERRAERDLIVSYEGLIDIVMAGLSLSNAEEALALLNLPDQIRGFGPVKMASMAEAARRQDKLLAAYRIPEPAPVLSKVAA